MTMITGRTDAPTDNLVRAFVAADAATLRATTGDTVDGRTLFGHFAVTGQWTDIDSVWEGTFREQIAPGAFERTFAERRDQIKVLYDHGHDPQLGNKPLGPINELREDKTGAYYEVGLIRTPYNDEFIIPAAEAGLLGASFRFKVTAEDWVEPRAATKGNPSKLPERTITDLDLYEFGPVTFPAYEGASTGVRSLTDDYYSRLLHDPVFLARFAARAGTAGVEMVEALVAHLPPAEQRDDTPEQDELPPPEQREQDESTVAPSATAPRQTIRPQPNRTRDLEMVGSMVARLTSKETDNGR